MMQSGSMHKGESCESFCQGMQRVVVGKGEGLL